MHAHLPGSERTRAARAGHPLPLRRERHHDDPRHARRTEPARPAPADGVGRAARPDDPRRRAVAQRELGPRPRDRRARRARAQGGGLRLPQAPSGAEPSGVRRDRRVRRKTSASRMPATSRPTSASRTPSRRSSRRWTTSTAISRHAAGAASGNIGTGGQAARVLGGADSAQDPRARRRDARRRRVGRADGVPVGELLLRPHRRGVRADARDALRPAQHVDRLGEHGAPVQSRGCSRRTSPRRTRRSSSRRAG